jgi:hypothetical protein
MSEAKAGTLLSVEAGCYSDYRVTGFFVVLKTFDPVLELKEYLVAHPKQLETYSFEEDEFLAALLAKGLLLEIQYGRMHMCDYSRASEFLWTPIEGKASSLSDAGEQ